MTAFSGWLAVGVEIAAGVLVEDPLIARVPAAGDVVSNVVTFPNGFSLGPFAFAAGPFAAWGLFDAVAGGAMLWSAAMPPLAIPSGAYLSFPAGAYPVTSSAGPGGGVVTIDGVPVTNNGQPLEVS